MSQQHQAQLQEAYQLVKSGNKQEATRLLLTVLREDRDSADAWWLLANATSDPEKQRQALNQVLRVKPDHNAAQKMLEKVNAGAAMRPAAPPPAPPAASPFSPPSTSARSDPFGVPAPAADPFAAPSTRTSGRPVADDPFADPFAASSSRTPAPADDPFGDPFGSTSTRTTGRAVEPDPYGDPFAPPSSSRTSAQDDDPFGDPFAAPPRSRASDDPFTQPRNRAAVDDPFAGERVSSLPDRPRVVVEKKRTNPLVIILAIIGIIVVLGCGLAAIAGIAGFNIFNQAIQTAMPEGTFQAAVQELQNVLTAAPNGTLTVDDNGIIGNIVEKGAIGFTQPIDAVLEADGFTNHAYKFTGESGQRVTIDLTAQSADFDVKLTLIGPDDTVVAVNDDIDFQNNNLNSRIETTLPSNGAYTVVVSDVGFGGGNYELVLR